MTTPLDDFIKNHISSINKNNVMTIDIGTIISKQIFMNKHQPSKIHKVIETLNHTPNVSIDSPQHIKSYFINNTILDIYPNKIMNYSYTTHNTVAFSYKHIDCKLIYMTINNKPSLNSHYEYNLIEDTEQVVIHYKNYFDIIISHLPNTTCQFQIKINKPHEQDILIQHIQDVLKLFN